MKHNAICLANSAMQLQFAEERIAQPVDLTRFMPKSWYIGEYFKIHTNIPSPFLSSFIFHSYLLI